MPDHLGEDMRKVKNDEEKEEKEIKCKLLVSFSRLIRPFSLSLSLSLRLPLSHSKNASLVFSALDEGDIALLKTYVSQT